MRIETRGWPWQRCGEFWANRLDKTAEQRWGWNPLNVKGMGRFGGGWAFKLGVSVSESLTDWVFDLGFGQVRIRKSSRKQA